MGKNLGRRAQATIDQLSLWDDVFDKSGAASAAVEPEADAPRDGAVLVAVAEEAGSAVVDQPESAIANLPRSPKTRCPAGHPYDEANTYVDRHGWRSCRACKRASDRLRRERTAKRLTPEQRIMRSRLAAYRLHATHDPRVTTQKARAAFASRFERQVDPDGVLAPVERAQRAEAARRAYFIALALRSSQARRRRRSR